MATNPWYLDAFLYFGVRACFVICLIGIATQYPHPISFVLVVLGLVFRAVMHRMDSK